MSPVAVRRQAAPMAVESIHLPAPIGGLNRVSPASAMPPEDCLLCHNLVAGEFGLRTRLGQRQWVTGLTGVSDNYVRCIMPFTGSAKSGGSDKLFCTTSSGIWDVSSSTTTPGASPLVAFPTTTGDAGYGTWTVFVTTAGHFLIYCDEVNGYYLYTQSGNAWTTGSVTGAVTAASLRAPLVFKNRLWFVEADTDSAWYLATSAITGTITKFRMGQNFRKGGPLVGLWSWTYDGGAGLDDSLVAVSNGGDVLVWQGTSPDGGAVDFALRGVWYAGGKPPEGRNIATTSGGDLLLLTRVGILPLSRLVVGSAQEDGAYTTAKIANLFVQIMLTRGDKKGWQMRLHPEENILMVVAPVLDGQATEQLVMALPTKSWSQYRDLPVYGAAEVWGGKLYFGTADGMIKVNDGTVDGVELADPNAFASIEWSAIQAYTNLGNGRQKQVMHLRPILLSEGSDPQVAAEARYNLSLTEVPTVPAGTVGAGEWDGDTWDSAVWGGEYAPSQKTTGAVGMGPQFAVAIKGKATSRTVWVGTDVVYTQGGFL